ncbi:MAG: YlxR family protein [Oscillospiraceae bacterium]|nr:YlxR family protein [Oscillospiraceae bacterium]
MEKKRPQRMCVVCRQMKDKDTLLRAVKNKDGGFSVDPGGKLPGRGAYVCKDGDCISRLEKVRGLERAFKGSVPAEIKEEILSMKK